MTVRMLSLMFVGLAGWMALLARSSASKDAELTLIAPSASRWIDAERAESALYLLG